MHSLALWFFASVLVAQAAPTPMSSPTASPVAPASSKHTLVLDIPHSWHRTESGRFNEWRAPDGTSNFRITPVAYDAAFHGPGATDALKALVTRTAAHFNPQGQISVTTVMVCNGTQPAYRFDDVLGMGTPAFMMFIPGATSTGLINYEIFKGGNRDPAIMAAIDKICWP